MEALPLALALDALIGDPAWLYRRVPHPVVLLGRLIAVLDRWLNRSAHPPWRRRAMGMVCLVMVAGVAGGTGWVLETALAGIPGGWILTGAIAATLVAQRSLHDHVAAVAAGLEQGGLDGGRRAVAMIVGRDPDSLDEAGVARAAVESCAENFSDGVAAPVFWFAVLGLPGLAVYKAVNTADSMIGHRSERYRRFGWASARFDDLLNLIPARLAGGLMALAAFPRTGTSLAVMWRDARRHRSPNAGWPEAAMAGALGLSLAGPRRYGTEIVEDAWLNPAGRRDAAVADIRRSLRLLVKACALLWLAVLALAACNYGASSA